MIKLCEAKQCTGCAACRNSCPKNCIRMEQDKDGFFNPVIDSCSCIQCGLCESSCPVIHPIAQNAFIKAYVGAHLSKNVRCESSSGGLFTALAESILERGGVVFAARFDPSFTTVYHSSVECADSLSLFRGSKYLQSRIEDCYCSVKKYLAERRYVLFIGTPCQAAGLRAFLKQEEDRLFVVDFVCHGVLSEKAFRSYLKEQLQPEEVLTFFLFRDKKHGNGYLNNHAIFYRTNLGREYSASFEEDVLGFGYTNNLLTRPSCSSCRYASEKRVADLTLCDYPWDLTEDQKIYGVSGVTVNTEQGENLLQYAKDKCELLPVDHEEILSRQIHLRHAAVHHKNRDKFYRDLDKGFAYSAQKHYSPYQPKKNKLRILTKRVRKQFVEK